MSKKPNPSSIDCLVVSLAPAIAMANSYCNLSFADGMAAKNMVHAQQQQCIQFQSTTALCTKLLLG